MATETPHGTPSGYGWHKCRCEQCRAWHAAYYREYKAARKEIPKDSPQFRWHGKLTGYDYGCRCEACKDARSEYAGEWRAKIRGKAA